MKLKEMTFTVVVFNGNYFDSDPCCQDSLQYERLTWAEASTLIRISFMQGYKTMIWRTEDE